MPSGHRCWRNAAVCQGVVRAGHRQAREQRGREGARGLCACAAGRGQDLHPRSVRVCVCVFQGSSKTLGKTMWHFVRLWGCLWTVKSLASLGVHTLVWQQHMLVLGDHYRGCLLGCKDPRVAAW